jgi:D-amino-acid dehydrogenase
VAIEPVFGSFEARLAGGIFTPGDESGDAHTFTERLADLCEKRGVTFQFLCSARRLLVEGGKIAGVEVVGPDGTDRQLSADAYIVALGSYSASLLRRIGISIPVYPVKGYSVTLPVGPQHHAPTTSLTDDARKLVFSRLGARLRVAGTAELAGFDTEINRRRCEAIVQRVFELFPDAGERAQGEFWAGLRPATPGNVPVIGGTRYPNLFLNTGHGTLGWTLACGSGKAVAALVSGKKPEIEFRFS